MASRSSFPRTSPRALQDRRQVGSSRIGAEPTYFPGFTQSSRVSSEQTDDPSDRSLRHLDSVPHHLLGGRTHFLTPERSEPRIYGTYVTYARSPADLFRAWDRAIAAQRRTVCRRYSSSRHRHFESSNGRSFPHLLTRDKESLFKTVSSRFDQISYH